MKTPKNNWIIRANGGYFDGLKIVSDPNKADHNTRNAAKVLNRVIMCGKGTIVYHKQEIKEAKGD